MKLRSGICECEDGGESRLKPKVDGEELLLELGKLRSGECLIANDSSYEGLECQLAKNIVVGLWSSPHLKELGSKQRAISGMTLAHAALGWKLSYEIIWYGASDLKIDSSGILNYLKRRAA